MNAHNASSKLRRLLETRALLQDLALQNKLKKKDRRKF